MAEMSHLLHHKLAVITGASGGLGRAIALRFAGQGASLALVARDLAALKSLLPELDAAKIDDGQTFHSISADLADMAQLEAAAESCFARLGGIDILVNNAAVQLPIGPLESVDWRQWQSSFDLNLFAPARLMQLAIPIMRDRGGGKIINLSGGGATSPRPDFSAYAAAKCRLVRLTETVADEVRADRIDVNAVAPGAMNTRMLDEVLAAGPDAARREYPEAIRRQRQGGASPGLAAELVALLASSLTDGITGKLISAMWDDWRHLPDRREELSSGDLYTLRRIQR